MFLLRTTIYGLAWTLVACSAATSGDLVAQQPAEQVSENLVPSAPSLVPSAETAANAAFDKLALSFPALNAVVMKQGKVIWSRQGGFQREAADGPDRDHNFYSIAKMITGTAFYQLEKAGKVNLDAPVTDIDGSLGAAFDAVTLRHLLGHTSGLRHYKSEADWRSFNDRRCANPSDAIGHFISDPLKSKPGKKFGYTTFGFTLLSHLLVEATNTTDYDTAMQSVLGDKYRFKADRGGDEKSTNYLETDGEFEPIKLSAECKFGGGGLIGSAVDLANFGASVADGLVDPADLSSWTTNNGEETGLAYGMSTGFSETTNSNYAYHSGGSPGGRGFLHILFDPKIVVALTANSDGPNHSETAFEIARAFAVQSPSTD
jgi:CubicO group peptidase (beta-lactamase class C family)